MTQQEYHFTDEELRCIRAALTYAAENAIHPEEKARFKNAEHTINLQHDHHDSGKEYESDRFAPDANTD